MQKEPYDQLGKSNKHGGAVLFFGGGRGDMVASREEATQIMGILKKYELLCGQLVNTQKSAVTFSPNVDRGTREDISRILGMQEAPSHGNYVGLPSTIGSTKKEIFSSVVGKRHNCITDWNPKCLKLPKHTCHQIDSAIARSW
ncbi:hypothetical protein LIER_21192 [Lithospermum erythrorhizon]|uniref:Uncharacterized protein n=1 Tax=Lithospermum erythrorhizon TaxID=34254 RepID=A0AAV3QS81_LITER